MAIAVIGMLDEREHALKLIKEQIERRGHKLLLIDISVGNGAIVPTVRAEVTCQELAALAAQARIPAWERPPQRARHRRATAGPAPPSDHRRSRPAR